MTWTTGVETIKTVDQGYVWLPGCMPKSASADLGGGLGSTSALSVTQSAAEAAYAAL